MAIASLHIAGNGTEGPGASHGAKAGLPVAGPATTLLPEPLRCGITQDDSSLFFLRS